MTTEAEYRPARVAVMFITSDVRRQYRFLRRRMDRDAANLMTAGYVIGTQQGRVAIKAQPAHLTTFHYGDAGTT